MVWVLVALVVFAPVVVAVGLLMGATVLVEIVALPFRVLAWTGRAIGWVFTRAPRLLLEAWSGKSR